MPREWPLLHYAVLAHWLQRKYDALIVITGGPEERKKANALLNLINGQSIDVAGRLSWWGVIALVKEMDLVVSGNTGIMHVAAALKKKQIALHGPTNARIWGPLNENARVLESSCPECPCLKLGYEYHRLDSACMHRIEPDEVKRAISSLIDKS